ncbi:MAG: NUDIX domain-containing protein [Gammaproteobacteria bacterium]|jgi:8-oxo-dGTP diphosphatase|nr:NUDIX domain-containing protein [Gammaproteobacteria bacterium]
MDLIIDFFKINIDAVSAAPIAFVALLCIAFIVAYMLVAWFQARYVEYLETTKLKLERQVRELEQATPPHAKTLTQPTESTAPEQLPDLAGTAHEGTAHELYMQLPPTHSALYNEGVVERYWAAGTSLAGVVEQDLIDRYRSQGIDDIRIILPNTGPDTIAYHQLHQFDIRPVTNTVHNQVDMARASHHELSNLLGAYEHNYLRKYAGIMYFNITILDDDAFLSPYGTTGPGDSNLTLHFNSHTNLEGYRYVENEFLRMWDAGPSVGLIPRKGGACSMIFINSSGCVLLYLLDQKPGISDTNKWNLIGGHIDEDESPDDCITRELLEKIEYDLLSPSLFHVFNMPNRLEFTYSCTEDFDISKMPLHEGLELRWFSEGELLALPANQIAFGFKPVIQFFLNERRSSDS